jgi:hypothetical protein
MVLTVGTSLFHSASWEAAGPLEGFAGYQRWLRRNELLREPRQRDRDAPTQSVVEKRLLDTDQGSTVGVEPWVAILPEELQAGTFGTPEHTMRFSAELATLLVLAEQRRQTPRELLCSYGTIVIPADPTRYGPEAEERKSYVAAAHLRAYLNRIAGAEKACLWEIPGLASTRPKELLAALATLREKALNLGDEYPHQIDLVVTGGFKLYGYVLAPLVTGVAPTDGRLVRLVYIHETGYAGGEHEPLVQMDARHVTIGAHHQELQESPWGLG